MTISGVLGATTSGPTGSVYDQVWDHITGLDFGNTCETNFNFFVKDRFPSWIMETNPKFIKFIEMFFEWLGCNNDSAILESMKDVDITPDAFVKLFKEVFAFGFPDQTIKTWRGDDHSVFVDTDDPDNTRSQILVDFLNPSESNVDVRNFLRYVKTLYQMKSIEEAYDFFFRTFYDGWVNISYPKTRMMRCSEAPFRGPSAGTTGAPCHHWGQAYDIGVPTGPCWCWDGDPFSHCWNPGGRTAGTPEDECDCPEHCAPGSPCGVYYDDEFGTISGLSKIQDSRVWQDYSYLIDSNIPWSVYWEYVKPLLHPAGLWAAGNYTIWDEFPQPGTTGDVFEVETPIIGFYTPYTFSTTENLRSNSQSVDLYPCGWNPYPRTNKAGGYTATSGHVEDSMNLWHREEDGLTAHDEWNTPLGLTGYTGGTAAEHLNVTMFRIFNHPNSWSNEVSSGVLFKNIQLGEFLYLSPINTVTGSPNDAGGSTADCGF